MSQHLESIKKSIDFEVALEALGQSRQPFMTALAEEKNKDDPSQAVIDYCESRLSAINCLQSQLKPKDAETIRLILNKDGIFSIR